ncbi:UDP-glucose/GDP-mannose dehydrogenase family protein [Brevibacillus formosus]|uniref:UDP-glucose 6-dehydrogenase n=1 Tax=Brevibacillus formosus TaxID=54913 RepID=A0A837KSL4_9BACL|nr:UDP-glucose/GDP-mannose dehydrogenase family protein [Brevibacillus formosus]KLH99901.1 UDP-glucose 6-dehydrogenase [Brevibacillus formosus]MED1959529.1 UDP-glucose/GDP-mannose dehydrogenase family protein [Brevibacillus formosus]PSJ95960.1 UDP-glucose/GDP-mannose dehydrogenase family protein [Brevibacillus formosus]GED56313.1 UDP-glucose 6-dehydrogenase [Brevibacillus formosus]
MKVAVIGTGYVGLTTAVSLAMNGHQVTGIDLVASKVEKLRQGISPIYEPGLDEALKKVLDDGALTFYTDLTEAKDAEIFFICVGTPEAADGTADLTYLLGAVSDIEKVHSLAPQERIVVIKSTVPVGTGEKVAGMLAGCQGVSVASNPEFLREGSALLDALEPSRIVIGVDNPQAAAGMEELYNGVKAPRVITTRANAELIKYASNAFLATRISFMNELARLSTALGTDIVTISRGMGLDSRIGPQFLRAGVGYGGSCFPKDTIALLRLAAEHNIHLSILDKVREVNNTQPVWFLEQLCLQLPDLKGKQIAVLGLTFKPDTDDIREAPSLKLIEALLQKGASVKAYDPIGASDVSKQFPQITYTQSAEEACEGAQAALLVTEWEQCVQLDWKRVHQSMAQPLLVDGRNAWPNQEVKEAGFHYIGVGRS